MTREGQPAYRGLRTIQVGLASGVLLFALIAVAVLRPSGAGADLTILRWVWLAVALLSVFGAGVVRGRLRREATGQQAYATAVMVWALAEGQALLGIVAYLVMGDRLPALLGLVVAAYLFVRYRASDFKPWFDTAPEAPRR